ncbi:MAG: flavodoxin-dependent (E)-4-hydroxy-3-methylbut-2-enyl-diphosphate synthase [Acidobacteriia bacterium]|jgi:(E)-4-hydroxy-3-methylbut-2-enyl-diphosphate synthase|nr:flavodoxin-dependent (E)-4-hydroxy-3-methylbut-2-enyl-diphosphate synthase [Terriglobia bacterium]
MRHPALHPRRKTRPVRVGRYTIGGDAPIVVQSMTKTDTRDVDATLRQIEQLEAAGCEIIRMAVPDAEAARAVAEIRKRTQAVLVADIHFQYRLALAVLDAGIDKLRINPGNIGDAEKVRAVVKKAQACGVPIRIGVNAGSLERHLLEKYGYPTPEAMVESALEHVRILEELDFRDIIISLKASSVNMTVAAYRLLASQVDYPFHLGITEAGTQFSGTVKSAIGLGILLAEGIGDTLRVSLAADPVEEVRVAYEILKALEIRARGPMIIACPTCGRLEVDMFKIVEEIERQTAHIHEPLHLAVMGCAVNGPGEARSAHVGVACGRGNGVIYRDGKAIRRVPEDRIVAELVQEIESYIADRKAGRPTTPEQELPLPAEGLVGIAPSSSASND